MVVWHRHLVRLQHSTDRQTVQNILSEQFTVYSLQSTVYSLQSTVSSLQHTICSAFSPLCLHQYYLYISISHSVLFLNPHAGSLTAPLDYPRLTHKADAYHPS
jgi:hypothetical protein